MTTTTTTTTDTTVYIERPANTYAVGPWRDNYASAVADREALHKHSDRGAVIVRRHLAGRGVHWRCYAIAPQH
jgi:hypothetical protein